MKEFCVELLGTFFLVLTIGCSIALNGGSPFAPIAIGLILMVMVYAGGYISGGHYNPAVSLGATLRGALSWKFIFFYWIAQFLGGAIGAWTAKYFMNDQIMGDPFSDITMKLILAEFLFTFALVFVVLHTATSHKTSGNDYYGLAIGSTVTAGILAVGTICITAFNPAVALGLGIMRLASWSVVFTTLGINFFAGIIAALVYRCTAHKNDFNECNE